jgi:hypothetical protein
MRRAFLCLSLLSASFLAVGCGSAPVAGGDNDTTGSEEGIILEGEIGQSEDAERWDAKNNPATVDGTFIYEVDKLPTTGSTKVAPIPADYWATYQDSINVRWDGAESLSPAEKWEKAFNKPGLAKRVSELYGIRKHTTRKECTQTSECADLKDGSECAIPRGETKGRCIPKWWGICHGWAPYAFSEPAPKKAVEKNGVTFYPGDLEGLMSLAYGERLPTKFLSTRCNAKDAPTDASGRVIAGECRDMNPGSFHVVASNMLGLRQQSFVYDRTWDAEVWNQPVRGFAITNLENGKLKEVTKAEAIKLAGIDVAWAELLAKTELAKDASKVVEYKATADGEVQIATAGTGDADLYVKVNGEPTKTAFDCKSDGGSSTELCKVTVKNGDTVKALVLGYADKSEANVRVGLAKANAEYTFNTTAARFFHVKMDFRFIVEASTARESRVDAADRFTQTDKLEYVLEADANGSIVGGEWIGASLTSHPDFVWWPSGKPTTAVAEGAVAYADLKALNDEAAGVVANTNGGTTPTPAPQPVVTELATNAAVPTAGLAYTLGAKPGEKLRLELTTTVGSADLYVRLGRAPTTRTYTCKGTAVAGSTTKKACELVAPAAGGSYSVKVVRRATTTRVDLRATITPKP